MGDLHVTPGVPYILYFHASWCVPCKTFGPVVRRAARRVGVGLRAISVVEESALVRKYELSSVPTVLCLDESHEVCHSISNASMTEEELVNAFTGAFACYGKVEKPTGYNPYLDDNRIL